MNLVATTVRDLAELLDINMHQFPRRVLEEWAYARVYRSEAERAAAYPGWLHHYNHHRGHTSFRGLPPISRVGVTNLCGQYT